VHTISTVKLDAQVSRSVVGVDQDDRIADSLGADFLVRRR
jgi:hypothetical protein